MLDRDSVRAVQEFGNMRVHMQVSTTNLREQCC